MNRGNLLLPAHSSRQWGVTLIELLISVTIGLLIMAGVLQLFASMIRNSTDLENSNAQIENGRFALQIIENDVVHAGFWGGFIPQFDDLTSTNIPTDAPSNVPAPCLAFALWNVAYKTQLVGVPVQTYDGVPAGCEAVITSKKANTDVLVVRHADSCVAGAVGCEADTSASASPKVYFQPQFCGNDIISSYVYVLGTSGFTLRKRSCLASDLSEKRKYVSNIYYVRDDDVLMRAEFGSGGGSTWGAAQPVVEGVEGFTVELGIDNISDAGASAAYTQAITWSDPNNKNSPTNRGDGTPDGAFVRCTTAAPCSAATLTNVVSAKLYVLVRNTTATRDYTDTKTYAMGSAVLGPFNDNVKRHVYSTTARLINISSRRQTP
ncbi:MAG: PilW family protein [Pseudomonadota bacterium]